MFVVILYRIVKFVIWINVLNVKICFFFKTNIFAILIAQYVILILIFIFMIYHVQIVQIQIIKLIKISVFRIVYFQIFYTIKYVIYV